MPRFHRQSAPPSETVRTLNYAGMLTSSSWRRRFTARSNDALASPSGGHGLSQTGAPPDATAGGARALPAAQDVSAAPGAPDLSLPAARSADHAAEPRVVHGCYLHSPAFLYLAPGDGWACRKVLSWRLSQHANASFCVEALHEACAMALRRSSTVIRAADGQASTYRRAHGGGHASRWTARAAGWTMFCGCAIAQVRVRQLV